MKVTKTAVYRITAGMSCGCIAMREYEDADYKKPVGEESTFTVCKKHKDQPGVDVLELVLTERVEEEAEKHEPAPAQPAASVARPNASAAVGENGELIMRVPIVQQNQRMTAVGPSRLPSTPTAARPAQPVVKTAAAAATATPPPAPVRPTAGIPRANAARTGPVKYQRPTAPSRPAQNTALTTAEADDEEPDLFEQNDSDFNNAR